MRDRWSNDTANGGNKEKFQKTQRQPSYRIRPAVPLANSLRAAECTVRANRTRYSPSRLVVVVLRMPSSRHFVTKTDHLRHWPQRKRKPVSPCDARDSRGFSIRCGRNAMPAPRIGGPSYSTTSPRLSEWLLNSGAYMHWIDAMPVWYCPLWTTRVEYSKTYVPLGK